MRIGSWVAYADAQSALDFNVPIQTGYVLARTNRSTGFAIPGPQATAWISKFGAPPTSCPWCRSLGFPLTTHVRSFTGATSPYDPGDGTLTIDRLETAGQLSTSSGSGTLGDFGNGLGSF